MKHYLLKEKEKAAVELKIPECTVPRNAFKQNFTEIC